MYKVGQTLDNPTHSLRFSSKKQASRLLSGMKVRVCIVLACNSVCLIRCHGDLFTSYDFLNEDCACKPHVLTYLIHLRILDQCFGHYSSNEQIGTGHMES